MVISLVVALHSGDFPGGGVPGGDFSGGVPQSA